MKIKIWGCRGSLPTPLNSEEYRSKLNSVLIRLKPEHLVSQETRSEFIQNLPFYLKELIGGNTTCIEVRDESNNVVIIDTGTGARELGISLSQNFFRDTPSKINILYTHTHWDHISGLMFFEPMFIPTCHISFWSMYKNLKKRLETQQKSQFFPVDFNYMGAKKDFKQFPPGKTVTINNLKITSMEMNHPGGCLGYRIEENGSVFTFCTDTEFDFDNKNDCDKYCNFIQDSNLVMFDTQYLIKEIHDKKNWGHSTGLTATDLCLKSNVDKLVMFHHEPADNDLEIYENCLNMKEYKNIKSKTGKLEILSGFEGQTFNI